MPLNEKRGQTPSHAIFEHVRIIDGSGESSFIGGIEIIDGRISRVWREEEIESARSEYRDTKDMEMIDGSGLCLAPGFIDIHCHSDLTILGCPQAESRILQGVTTEIGGNCGLSPFPVVPQRQEDLAYYLREGWGDKAFEWEGLDGFLKRVETMGVSTNLGCLVGHGSLRLAVMGFSDQKADDMQIEEMKHYLRQAMEEGAFGMSSGLIYLPGTFADTQELIDLCKVLPAYGGLYTTHMRDEGYQLIPSVEETLKIGRESGAAVHISHHKETRRALWHTAVRKTLQMMQDARATGMDVTFDQYPYSASATTLDSNISEWAFEGGRDKLFERLRDPQIRVRLRDESNASHVGRWNEIVVSYACGREEYEGKSIEDIANVLGKDPADTCFDIVLETNGQASEVNYGMSEEDVEFIMTHDFGMICSDGEARSLTDPGVPHPRNYGSFPKVIAHYARDRQLITLEAAVRKMTGLSADRMGLKDRGYIKPGMWADLVLFDYDKLTSDPDYKHPKQACSGIRRVYVNGVLTAQDGRHTGARAGMTLRRGQTLNTLTQF